MSQNLIDKLPKVRGQYRQNAALKNWFDVGGNAEILYKPADIADLEFFLKNISKEIPVTILGAASNVIIRDGGIEGVVIRLGAEFAKVEIADDKIIVGAAALCGNVATHSKINALAGLEFLSGIPGSVGGAIAMNGGCYGSDISKILISATALDYQGNLHQLKNSDFNFYYRGNKIASDFIFVSAVFKGQKSTVEEVAKKIEEFNKQREAAQPIRAKTGGSTFKNPFPEEPAKKKAWQYIDEVGFRGKKINDAEFSNKHCNFMINTNKARAKDLIDLALNAQKAVKDQSGQMLQLEIKILGKD